MEGIASIEAYTVLRYIWPDFRDTMTLQERTGAVMIIDKLIDAGLLEFPGKIPWPKEGQSLFRPKNS
jgi:hypothetical protein